MARARPASARKPTRVIGAFTSRPRLLISMGAGLIVAAAALILTPLGISTAAVLGWDAMCATFALAMVLAMSSKSPAEISHTAEREDEGRGLILGLVILSAIAGVLAVGIELSQAKSAEGLERAGRVALAFGTVAASWFMVNLIFALHYAHEYYMPDEGGEAGRKGGLKFPGGGDPDYWDFLHFALVIGVAAQTADIGFTTKPMRRTGTLHCVLAFVFNTMVLALSINLAAGLF